ncbi:MAG: PilZ domain-containing protein [Nitrospirota bacterium]|nr:PilZ domain-containing protein [Nitrospirota bacterium]
MTWGSVYLHRQRAPRVSISLPVEYDADGASDTLSAEAADSLKKTESKNISEGGLLLILPDRLDLDSTITVRIHVPIKYYTDRNKISPVLAKARVVWTDLIAEGSSGEYHCGISFTDIAPEDLALLREFINRCLSSENPLK